MKNTSKNYIKQYQMYEYLSTKNKNLNYKSFFINSVNLLVNKGLP